MYHSRIEPDKQSSYMDGIPVKISELYKPPKKITLPLGIVNRQPIEHFEEYDFRLERSTAEKMSRLRELKEANKEKRRQRLEAENKRLEELKKAEDTKQTETRQDSDSTPTQETENQKKISEPEKISEGASYVVPICAKTSKGASYVNPMCATEHNMLTPVPVNLPVPVQSISNFNPIKSNQHFNISDFESDSSPFDNMELKTLNDIAELASVLQPNNDVPKPTYQNYQSTDNRKVPKPSYHTYQSPDNQDVPKPTYQNYQSTDNHEVPKPSYHTYQSPDNQDVAKPTYQNYQSTDNRDVAKPTYHTYQSPDNQDVPKPTYQNYQSPDNQDVAKPTYHTYQSTDNQDVAKPTYHTYQSTDNQDVAKPTYQNYQSTDNRDVTKPTYHTYQSTDNNQDVPKPSYHTYQSTDNQDVAKPTYHTYQSTDNNQDVPKATYHTYQDNNQLYNHQSYPIKHSRTFIQQPGNLVPNNGYTYGNMFNNTSVSDTNPTFWDQQQRVSYSSTMTTTVFGVTSPYTTEPGVYSSQNSDINAVRPKIGEYRLNVGGNTVYSSDYRVKLGESAGYSSDYRPNSQETQTQNRPADNTGYLGNEYAHRYIPQTASKFGATSSTNNGVYASKFGGTATNSGANNSSKFGEMTTNLGANSQYAAKFGGGTPSTVNLGTTNSYLMQAQGVMNSRGSETEDTSEYLNTSSDYMKPISSEYLNSKIGGSKNSVNYAQGFSWSGYNYGATNSGSQLVVNQVTKNSGSHLAENSENHLLVSENSDVTNLIRELKLELDDRRENDSRKMMQNERVIVTSVAVENDKLRQKVSKPEAVPLLANPINQLTTSCRNLVLRISEMGFAQERVARAVERLGDNETKVLEFLLQLQRLEEDSGCTGERVELAFVNNRYDAVESVRYLEVLQQLLDLGFNEAKVAEALAQHANDRDKALESLIS